MPNDLSWLAFEPRITKHGTMYDDPWARLTGGQKGDDKVRVMIVKSATGETWYFDSITEAAKYLERPRASVRRTIKSGCGKQYQIYRLDK